MPAPALKSLAQKAGKSMKDAERYYNDAKRQRMKSTGKSEKGLESADYRYIMGIVKKRLGLGESLAELMIESQIAPRMDDYNVRVFRDLEGDLSFATLEDVHIDPESDDRVFLIHRLANEYDWPSTSEFPESIEGYEGSITDLAKQVISKVFKL